jgi:AcrR family transcriptional regulator
MMSQPDGRVVRRHEVMRRAQAVALALFEQRGFDVVTVDDVARRRTSGRESTRSATASPQCSPRR